MQDFFADGDNNPEFSWFPLLVIFFICRGSLLKPHRCVMHISLEDEVL